MAGDAPGEDAGPLCSCGERMKWNGRENVCPARSRETAALILRLGEKYRAVNERHFGSDARGGRPLGDTGDSA